jgi:hypothetical protein
MNVWANSFTRHSEVLKSGNLLTVLQNLAVQIYIELQQHSFCDTDIPIMHYNKQDKYWQTDCLLAESIEKIAMMRYWNSHLILFP